MAMGRGGPFGRSAADSGSTSVQEYSSPRRSTRKARPSPCRRRPSNGARMLSGPGSWVMVRW